MALPAVAREHQAVAREHRGVALALREVALEHRGVALVRLEAGQSEIAQSRFGSSSLRPGVPQVRRALKTPIAHRRVVLRVRGTLSTRPQVSQGAVACLPEI
jgi:hypothetical protein